jgi:hypothetical protein
MNLDHIKDNFTRLLLIALVLHVFRDWGWAGGWVVVLLAAAVAIWQEYLRARDARAANSSSMGEKHE